MVGIKSQMSQSNDVSEQKAAHEPMTEIYAAIIEFFTSNVNIVLALVMLAAFALVIGAFALWRRTGSLEKPVLMVVLALVALANVLIWTVPTTSGESPMDQADAAREEAGAQ